MSDEAIVEVMAERLIATLGVGARKPHAYAADLLAALRSEGFEVYRPDECERVEVVDQLVAGGTWGREILWLGSSASNGVYRLVPVPAESEEGNE